METGNRMLKSCLLILVLLAGFSAFAQNTEESTSYVTKTPEGFLVHQIIVFPAVSNTIRYEVEIEQQTGAGYVPVHKLETAENKFEVSLRAGNYRYRITSWNRMNLLEGRSEWQNFQVFPAVLPVLETYEPYYGLYYEMEDTVGTLTITGKDFFPESEFGLVNHNKNSDKAGKNQKNPDWTGINLETYKRAIIPDQVLVADDHVILYFGPGKLKKGDYNIIVRNPGGLWTTLGEVRVGQKHLVDWTFSFGWAPTFSLFDLNNSWYEAGYDFSGTIIRRQLDGFEPRSYYARIAIIPVKTRIGNFGIEAQFDFLVDNETKFKRGDNTSSYGRTIDTLRFGTFNLLYQYILSERWQHNARFGVGWGNGYHKDEKQDPWGGWSYHDDPNAVYFQLGYSTQYFLWKNLYAEAGIDFLLSRIPKLKHNHFMIRPGIGMGWQAGRWSEWAEVAEGQKKGENYSVPVTDKPRAEWLLSLGWAPMIPLAGYDRYGWMDDVPVGYRTGDKMLWGLNPLGFNLRAAYIPLHWGDNKLGIEFEMSVLDFPGRRKMDRYNSLAFLFSDMVFGIRYQRVLNEDWQLNARAALGMIPVYAFNADPWGWGDGKYHSNVSGYNFGLKLGASAQYFFRKNAYIEGGLDIAWTKTGQDDYHGVSNDPRLYLKPSIGIGWQFNRNTETGLRLPGTGLPHKEETADAALSEEAQERPARDQSAIGSLYSFGGGLFLDSDFGGGYKHSGIPPSDPAMTLKLPYYGGGLYGFFDARYLELNLGFFAGGGKVKLEADPISTKDTQAIMSINFGLLGKYPFTLSEKISIFPLLGIEYHWLFYLRVNGNKLPASADFNTLWFKTGVGVDYSITDRVFSRLEVLYGIRLADKMERNTVDIYKSLYNDAKTRLGHGLTIKAAVGYRLGR